MKSIRKEGRFQFLEIVANIMDELIVGQLKNVLPQVRRKVVLPEFFAYFPGDNGAAVAYFLCFVLVEQLLQVENGSVECGSLQRRNEMRSEEHTSELQSRRDLVCRLLLEKKKKNKYRLHDVIGKLR